LNKYALRQGFVHKVFYYITRSGLSSGKDNSHFPDLCNIPAKKLIVKSRSNINSNFLGGIMAEGKDILQKGIPHVGESYIYGTIAPKDNPNWKGPWDCAEFISWCVFQAAQKLYGCDNDKGKPSTADAYTGYWRNDLKTFGIKISVAAAARTAGAIVLRFPIAKPKTDGHIVISDGMGGTIEAKSHKEGVVKDTLTDRRWDTGVLIPGVIYAQNDPIIVKPPTLIIRLTRPVMKNNIIREIQRKLKEQEIDPGKIDGEYGPHTLAAVVAFQRIKGIVADGEVGLTTATALGIDTTPFQ
jgi:N-acetylmuramoyl-L-alanine amidase